LRSIRHLACVRHFYIKNRLQKLIAIDASEKLLTSLNVLGPNGLDFNQIKMGSII